MDSKLPLLHRQGYTVYGIDRAAIMVTVATLKGNHDLEEREEALNTAINSLKHQCKTLDMNTQLAAVSSKLAVFTSADDQQGFKEFLND